MEAQEGQKGTVKAMKARGSHNLTNVLSSTFLNHLGERVGKKNPSL